MPDIATAPTATNAQTRAAGSKILGFYTGTPNVDCLFDLSNFALLDGTGALIVGAGAGWTGGFERLAVKASSSGGRAISGWNSSNSGSAFLGRIDDTAAQLATWFYGVGTPVGSITTNGTSTAYNTSSDYRLKDDLRPLEGALDRLLKLPVYDFKWKSDGSRARGFLAHEFGDAIPGATHGVKDGMRSELVEVKPERLSKLKDASGQPIMIPAEFEEREVPDHQGIDQAKAVPDLVAAVQELYAIVMAQADEIAALKAVQP